MTSNHIKQCYMHVRNPLGDNNYYKISFFVDIFNKSFRQIWRYWFFQNVSAVMWGRIKEPFTSIPPQIYIFRILHEIKYSEFYTVS
jgi:hypothetical protein